MLLQCFEVLERPYFIKCNPILFIYVPPQIRLALMSPKYLIENVNESELLKKYPECRAILLRTLNPMLDHMSRTGYRSFVGPSLTKPRMPSSLLLAIGGWTEGNPTSLIEAYDAQNDQWVDVDYTTETPRAYHGAVFLDGSVYCVGGFDSVEQFSAVHRLDLATHTWQEVSPMHVSRCFVSVTVMDEYIYALGGYNGHERLNTAERYEPRSNQWTCIASMHEQRSDASCATLHDRVGGSNLLFLGFRAGLKKTKDIYSLNFTIKNRFSFRNSGCLCQTFEYFYIFYQGK